MQITGFFAVQERQGYTILIIISVCYAMHILGMQCAHILNNIYHYFCVDSTARRNTLANALELMKATRGKVGPLV